MVIDNYTDVEETTVPKSQSDFKAQIDIKQSTVIIIEDNLDTAEMLSGLISTLDFQTQIYNNPEEFIDNYQDTVYPRCLLLDVRMPTLSGLELQAWVNQQQVPIPIIFLTGFADVDIAVTAMKGGAIDFLTKPVNHQHLFDAINHAFRINHEQLVEYQQKKSLQQKLNTLSTRETEIFNHLIAGKLSKEIGRLLGISSNTVNAHRANIFKKLQIDTTHKILPKLYRYRLL